MKMVKSVLLSATVIAGLAGGAAHAQIVLPAPSVNDGEAVLHGAGATAVQNVVVQEFNCIGRDFPLGTSAPVRDANGTITSRGGLTTIPNGVFAPASPSTANPSFTCTINNVVQGADTTTALFSDIQPNFAAKYVATGSGFGRQMWRLFSNQFDPATPNVFNPFVELQGSPVWTRLQYAFSESNMGQGEVNAYNTNAAPVAGPAVVFPKYVLPVAVVYNPVYGINAGGAAMRFNIKKPQNINGIASGGLPLSRAAYCGIFNGAVRNWNDPVFRAANANTDLRDTVNDTATRWAADGVPIRMLGRLDRSGTTDVFSRHLATVCTGQTLPNGAPITNVYARNAESLPYNASSGVDLANVRSDTGYATGNNNGGNYPNAGNGANLVSGTYFNGTTFVEDGGPTGQPNGNQGSGLYITGDGSGRVRDAINLAPDYALNGVRLNGKVGYIGADFVVNALAQPDRASRGLFAAALQVNGTGTVYVMPSAANGALAFGTSSTAILPPQSSATGAFTGTDTRTVPLFASSGTGPATRDNPIAWTAVLYANPANTLAAPVKGYPITGTTQFLGYTCYQPGNRLNVVEFLGLNLGKITRNSANRQISANTFKGTGATLLGILSQSNVGVVPPAWQSAISETFLKRSTQAATVNGVRIPLATYGNGGNGLWIQSKYLLNAADVDTVVRPTDVAPNPGCAGRAGA